MSTVRKFQYQDKEGLPVRDVDMCPAQLAEMYFICKEHLKNSLIGIEYQTMTQAQQDAIRWLKDHSAE